MRVKIEGEYEDGAHGYSRTVNVPEPDEVDDEWWWDVVFEHTGNGRAENHLGYCHTATIVGGRWDGKTYEWSGR